MSQTGGGGALENFDMQGRLGELLATLGADQTEGTAKTTKSTTLPDIHDTTSTSESGSETTSTIDPGNPSLVPPNIRKSNQEGSAFSGNGDGTNVSSGISVPEGTEVTAELQQLIDFSLQESGVKALYHLVGDDKVTLALLNEFFEAEGIPTPVAPGHPKMEEAALYGLETFFDKTGVSSPDAKAQLVIAGTSATKVIVNYFDFLSSVEPAGRTVNSQAGIQQLDGYLLSAEELIRQIVDELKAGAKSLPGGAPEGILSYLKFIADLVAELRRTLSQLSFEDSEMSGKIGVLMSQTSDLKRESVVEKFEVMYEKLELQKHMQYIEKFMNILNPIMGSFSIIVAMALLPINPVIGFILLGIAISWFVITTTLQQTGI